MSIFNLRLGAWQEVLTDIEEIDALIGDPPYGKRILLDAGWYRALTRPNVELVETHVLYDDDPYASNTLEHPDRVQPRSLEGAKVEDGVLRVTLPPIAWAALALRRVG